MKTTTTRDEPMTLTRQQIVELCERLEGRDGDRDAEIVARLVRQFLYAGFIGISVGLVGLSHNDHQFGKRHG